MHDHAGGLVDHDDRLVLVNDVEFEVALGQWQRRTGRGGDPQLDCVARHHAAALGGDHLVVETHLTGGDQRGGLRA